MVYGLYAYSIFGSYRFLGFFDTIEDARDDISVGRFVSKSVDILPQPRRPLYEIIGIFEGRQVAFEIPDNPKDITPLAVDDLLLFFLRKSR
jgi:hypothetical protein